MAKSQSAKIGFLLFITWGLSLFSLSGGWCQESQPRPSRTTPFEYQQPARKEPQLVRVPNVLGQTQNQASGTLTRARLRMGNVGRRTASQPSGTVVQQNPKPGAMAIPGSAVDLWLAEPSEVNRVKVPDVRGKNQDQAANILARAGLQLGRIAKKIDNRPAGTVIQQDQAPGSMVPPRTPVNLWLAEPREVKPPPTKVRVPHLITDTQSQASRALERAGLQVGRVARITSSQNPGTVVRQSPEPGTAVSPGSAVNLWLAVAPEVNLVTVPDVNGQTQGQATRTLANAGRDLCENLGLRRGRVALITSKRPAGTVVRQDPGAGKKVRCGWPVNLWLAAAPPPPPPPAAPPEKPGPVPPEVQTPLTEVQTPLPPVVKQPPPEEPPSPPGIKTQEKAPRAPEKPPLPQPIRKVPVPSLVGKNREWGRNILIDQGLQEGEVITRQADLESGIIIDQDPEPGTLVPPGTRVTLVVSFRESVTEKKPHRSWGAILVGLLAVLGGGYYGVKRLIRTWLLRAIQIRPKTDMGTQHFALDAPLHLDVEVRLKPVIDPGQQNLKAAGPLVLEEEEKP
jgi:beta-lactam-binding protein with PASTA domain